jgi:hypothetical protein
MCTRKALSEIGGFHDYASAGYVDYQTWLALTDVGEVKALDDLLGYYRQHSNQATESNHSKMVEASAEIAMSHFLNLPNEIKEKTGLTSSSLRMHRRALTGDAYCHQAKIDWSKGRWSLARTHFIRSLILGNFKVKNKAILGLFLTSMKVNYEFFAKHF